MTPNRENQDTPPARPARLGALFARRPIQPVKVAYGAAWLNFLLVACLLVAWWFPVKILLSHLVWPKVIPVGPRDAYAFVALGYEGVSTKESEVSPRQFREHVEVLKDAGYAPITLKDVEGLVREGKPVPRKSVLVTFDHGRRTSYFDTHAILRRAGWNAVMFLWTKPILDRDPAALLWPYLRSMIRSGLWEVGAQSHDGLRRIETSSAGRQGNFMTSPRWLADESRFETLAEFQRRLDADHDTCHAQIKRGLGVEPLAYAYPFGDFGQFQHRAIVTRPINLGLVEQRYKLGFILGNLALNTRHSDARRLNRLLVDPSWSGKDLLERLERSWPMESPTLEKEGKPIASAWIVDWGAMEQESDGSLAIYAPTNATGAKIWLAGSDMNRDFYTRIRFRLDRGQLGVYLRATADGESYVYLGLDAGGEVWLRQMARGKDRLAIPDETDDSGVWLRQKQVGTERFTLASSQIPINPRIEHTLEVFLRDRLLFAHLDGKELFRSRSMLRGELKPGLVGLSVWAPQKGYARARLTGIEVREQHPAVASWNVARSVEPHVFRWIYENAFRLTDLSPQWMESSAKGGVAGSPADMELYRMLARVNHLSLNPQIVLSDEAALNRTAPTVLAERAKREKLDGLLINMSEMRDVSLPAIASWLRQCASSLAEGGAKLLIRLPQALETRAQIHSLLAVVPNAKVVVTAGSPVEAEAATRPGQIVRAEPVPAPPEDEELPLFYMIPAAGDDDTIESQEAKSSRLQQEGLAAYLDAQYDRAVKIWSDWRAMEPDNPKASMLIGDALVRAGDLRGAAREYDRSLDLDPGQISLAVRRAGLSTSLQETDKTIELLNLYARLFPGNPDILLAQARWLNDNNRGEEAAVVARMLVEFDPENVEALTMLLRFTKSGEEYRDVMSRVVAAGAKPENHLPLAQAAWKYELTTMQGAEPLIVLIRNIAKSTSDPRVAELVNRMNPIEEPAVETFADGQISARWWMEGGRMVPGVNGGAVFASGETYSEGSLRLLGSLHLRNVYIEADVGRARGNFWLYSSRTTDHMARFGFTDAGYLHLQVWRGGRLLGERKMEWKPPAEGRVRLRLEANGDGIMGYINGRAAFGARVQLPSDVGTGWAGLSVHSTERGQASAEMFGLTAGASPARLGVLAPVASTAEADAQLAVVREDVANLTALCPAWYTIQPDGRWAATQLEDRRIYDIFARYHRIWLTPFVDCQSPAAVLPQDLEARAAEAAIDGFILMFKEWPGDEWIVSMRNRMRESKLRILVASVDAAGRSARVRPIARGGDFLSGGAGDPPDMLIVRRAEFKDGGTAASMQPVMIGY